MREVGGVYLAPTSAGFRARCRQAADRLGFAVPCPLLLPTLASGVRPPRLCEPPGTCRRGLVLMFQWDGFQVPVGYRGPSEYGTLAIVAGPARGVGPLGPPCSDERRVAAPTVQQARAVLVTCADEGQRSSWGGSMLLRWSQRGTLTVVTVYGWSELNRRLLVEVADHLRLVGPSA